MITRPAIDAPAARDGALARAVRAVPLTAVWAVAAVAVPVAIVGASRLSAVDLAYHLRAGRIMLDAGSILRDDVFTIWGGPWLNQQWGSQVMFAAVFGAGGWLGLAVMRSVVAASVLGLLYASCRNAGASPRWAAGLTISSGILITGGFILRPQVLGVVCFVTTQWLLTRRLRHPSGVWWALPVTVVWANTHGSFFLAPVLFAVAWAQARDRNEPSATPLLVAGLATIPLALLNPLGVRVWGYAVSIAGDDRIRNEVAEWRPPTVETLSGALFLISVVAVALVVGARGRSVRWPTLAGLGFFLVLGLTSIRGGLWWYLAAPVLVAGVPALDRRRERSDPRGVLNVALIGMLGLMALGPLLRWLPYGGAAPPERLVAYAPVGMTSALEGVLEPGEPLFAAQQWGSWFELALPDNPVFVDARWEAIPDRAWDAYRAVSDGRRDWQAILERHGIDVLALAGDRQARLLSLVRNAPGWTLVHEDRGGAVFVRST